MTFEFALLNPMLNLLDRTPALGRCISINEANDIPHVGPIYVIRTVGGPK